MSCRRYYNYIGSLTVPPCTEGVIWTISKKVRTVSLDQVKLLREAVHDHAAKNARPLQPDHQRDIQLIGGGVLILFPINFVWDSSKLVNHDASWVLSYDLEIRVYVRNWGWIPDAACC
ncbi:alpha carbonic anhydrase 7-like protein [Tanacetum coccineum]|uniref:Alpha carbonic anhydrase 7-like protein n=1 Tax=Tanacetum coccineum TaxID=301880 RepID=A0ABQ5AAJ2_9ASTR